MRFLLSFFLLAILAQVYNASKLADSEPFDKARAYDVGSLVTTLMGLVTSAKIAKAAAATATFLLKAKPVMIVLGAVYMITFLLGFIFPAAPAILGLRSLNDVSKYLDVSSFSSYFTEFDLTTRAFEYMKINEPACRQRAACELGEYMSKRFSTVATAMRVFSNAMPASYSDALVRGTEGTDCAIEYSHCLESPLESYG